ncbi:putative ArCR [Candidatus Gugararchaeum adminiculabundum]|nr:putative ArCR [Candidatus Gugararchaeum adminiculabundum]
MPGIRRLHLDVLKPSEPSIIDLAKKLTALKGVETVDIVVKEVDRRVEKVRIVAEGDNLDFEKMRVVIEGVGASVHGIDRVTSGGKLASESEKGSCF